MGMGMGTTMMIKSKPRSDRRFIVCFSPYFLAKTTSITCNHRSPIGETYGAKVSHGERVATYLQEELH